MGNRQVLQLRIRVDLIVMAIKGYSALPRFQKLEPHNPMQFNVITRIPFSRVSGSFAEDTSAYSKRHPQGVHANRLSNIYACYSYCTGKSYYEMISIYSNDIPWIQKY